MSRTGTPQIASKMTSATVAGELDVLRAEIATLKRSNLDFQEAIALARQEYDDMKQNAENWMIVAADWEGRAERAEARISKIMKIATEAEVVLAISDAADDQSFDNLVGTSR